MNLWDYSSSDAEGADRIQFETYIYAVFFGILFLERAGKSERGEMWKITINELGKKYKLTTKDWPDYSIGIDIVRDAIEN